MPLCVTGEEAGGELVLDVAGRPQPDLGLQPIGVVQLKRVLGDPVELQLALLPKWSSLVNPSHPIEFVHL